MASNLTGLTLVLAMGALGVAGYALLRERSAPRDADLRMDAIEARIARIEEAAAARGPRIEDGPSLIGRSAAGGITSSQDGTEPPVADPVELAAPGASGPPLATQEPGAEPPERIQELVDEAVEKKAAQIQVMSDKKPSIDVFAGTLELSDLQRQGVEEEVLRGQREIYALLETPTADGAIFMDELVEVLAVSIAHPDRTRSQWAGFLGRLLSEKVPGTDETYAMRAEAVKDTVRQSFRRNWTEAQYAKFEAWQMDPTEIKDIEGSPWEGIEQRVLERAEALGARTPEGE